MSPTRDLPVTCSAGDSSSINVRRTMHGSFRLRAPFTALLTLRLADSGHDVVGLVAHVPQYLHELSYPDAAIALLRAVDQEHGPRIPFDALEARSEEHTPELQSRAHLVCRLTPAKKKGSRAS